MTLKYFLTKQKWGDNSLFPDMRSASSYIRSLEDAEYSSVDSLAGFLGQISLGQKPPSKNLLDHLRKAVRNKTSRWNEEHARTCLSDLEEILQGLQERHAKTKNPERAAIQKKLERAIQTSRSIFVLVSQRQDATRWEGTPLNALSQRFFESAQIRPIEETRTPNFTICATREVLERTYFQLSRLPNDHFLASGEDQDADFLTRIRRKDLFATRKIQLLALRTSICWASAILLDAFETTHIGFLFSIDAQGDFSCIEMNESAVETFERNLVFYCVQKNREVVMESLRFGNVSRIDEDLPDE